jgi:hypothetical protein
MHAVAARVEPRLGVELRGPERSEGNVSFNGLVSLGGTFERTRS